MKWYSKDGGESAYSPMTEHRTVEACKQIVGIAIGRWLLSGLDLPDMTASDGVSEVEAAMDFQ